MSFLQTERLKGSLNPLNHNIIGGFLYIIASILLIGIIIVFILSFITWTFPTPIMYITLRLLVVGLFLYLISAIIYYKGYRR